MFYKIKDFVYNHRALVAFMVGVVFGAAVTYAYFQRVETKVETADPEIKTETQVVYKDKSVIQYVPKEVVVDGHGHAALEDTDVQINKSQPSVDVKFNGNDYKFGLQQGETQKFQNGKLVVDQSSALKVDITAEVQKQVTKGIEDAFKEQEQKPKYKLGVEAGYDDGADASIRLSRQSSKYDIDLRVDKDKDVKAGITWWF